ncbi:MAG: hypothetical protein F6K54_35705 [Okeania sp. SIO3B5]|uniref:hypothetical protein n=1 Tax=Okeania sp. SIO3B5 TaxID=2607811 RepID=UPI0013FFA529|nr:hypothetical protein [Okeania sp. SIO3B5]NEO57935.1 hypothetical protein [Okeania sp. SIO3B5]
MGFFAWVGSLIDQFLSWLGEVVRYFIEALVYALQKIWETFVVGVLIAAFGAGATLYVIFYAGAVLGETIMEIWDPRYTNSKPSEVFTLKQAPQDSPLPEYRSEAKVLELENWS